MVYPKVIKGEVAVVVRVVELNVGTRMLVLNTNLGQLAIGFITAETVGK